jgi:RimK family alpha-L-glutamate ligase
VKIAILNAGTGWHTDDLCRALNERGHVGTVCTYEALTAHLGTSQCANSLSSREISLFDVDAVLARIIPNGSLDQIVFRVNALHWLEQHGVLVVNSPRSIERTVDKFFTSALLQEASIPVPETVVCESREEAMATVERFGEVIIKPIFGSMCQGLVRVNSPDVAFRVIQALEQLRTVFYVQRAVDHDGRDVRVFVVDGRVIGAMERHAPEGDWRTNVARGGVARSIRLPPEWDELAIRAADVVGADYAGVDLLPARDGQVFVLEVNGIPGWKGLQRVTGLDVAGIVTDHLIRRIRTFNKRNR